MSFSSLMSAKGSITTLLPPLPGPALETSWQRQGAITRGGKFRQGAWGGMALVKAGV